MNTSAVTTAGLRCLAALVLAFHAHALPAAGAEVNFLSFGDWGYTNSPAQIAVARRMATYATGTRVRFDAALLLGDNFYGKMPGGVADPRWQAEFERMYDAKALPMPFYAALGNHDYEQDKAETQLEYSRKNPGSRWKMPARWYRLDFPAKQPLASVFVLDSNFKKLSPADWEAQLAWFDQEMQKTPRATWTIALAHHPLYTAGQHGDTKEMLSDWGPLFAKHRLDFFFCGHDHDLQHLEIESVATSFILAGGGGAKLRPMKRDDRGPFSRSLNGFFHFRADDATATGRFIEANGAVVHEFERSREGKVSVVKTTGRDKAVKDKGEEKDK